MDDDDLQKYLEEIAKLPLLTAAAEREIATKGSEGDPAARKALIEANLRLVLAIARRFRDSGTRMIDLIQEGNVGLVRAVEQYDVRAGVSFSTFARPMIRRAIERLLG